MTMLRRRLAVSALVLLAGFLAGPGISAAAQPSRDDGPSARIVNGDPIAISQAPWQVALVRSSVADNYNAQFCGGSLVSATHVVTAAHCVPGLAPSGVEILAGVGNLNESTTRIAVSGITSHPSYNAATTENDIAVITLQTPVALDGTLRRVIALPPPAPAGGTTWPVTGESVWVSGWGALASGGSYPTQLQGVTVGVLADPASPACGSYPDPAGGTFQPATMLCAGAVAPNRDSCQGDSGGPAAIDRSGTWTLAGVVSWGYGCADPSYPGIYSRVTTYREWVLAQTSGISTPPAEPTTVSASAGHTSAAVSWAAPTSDGGAAVTSYTAIISPGGATCATATTSCTVSGLAPGTSYQAVVVARNTVGPSFSSTSASFVTPALPPAPQAAPAPAPIVAPVDPCAPLSGVAKATCEGSASRTQAVDQAQDTRARALDACQARSGTARKRCTAAATATYRQSVAKANAARTRDIALARCDSRTGRSKKLCTSNANAAYSRSIRVAAALRARTIALAGCSAKRGSARRACTAVARARYARSVKVASAVRSRSVARARCQGLPSARRTRCVAQANRAYRVKVTAANSQRSRAIARARRG
jgi:secreted trypsin-like serine protease